MLHLCFPLFFTTSVFVLYVVQIFLFFVFVFKLSICPVFALLRPIQFVSFFLKYFTFTSRYLWHFEFNYFLPLPPNTGSTSIAFKLQFSFYFQSECWQKFNLHTYMCSLQDWPSRGNIAIYKRRFSHYWKWWLGVITENYCKSIYISKMNLLFVWIKQINVINVRMTDEDAVVWTLCDKALLAYIIYSLIISLDIIYFRDVMICFVSWLFSRLVKLTNENISLNILKLEEALKILKTRREREYVQNRKSPWKSWKHDKHLKTF